MNEDNFKFGNSFISRQKISTEYGVDIIDKQKLMSYPENLYYCYNYERKVYETISSNRIIDKGFDIIDVYGERNVVIDILYQVNK